VQLAIGRAVAMIEQESIEEYLEAAYLTYVASSRAEG
jgi:hypothetical protein